MTVRLRIDRISVDAGALPPGGEAAFRRQLAASLRDRLADGGGPTKPGAGAGAADRTAAAIHRQMTTGKAPR